MSFYEDLGVAHAATVDEIHERYRVLVRLLHPDHQTDPILKSAAEEQMRRINEISAVLTDPEKRRRYDAELAGAIERAAPIIIHAPRAVALRQPPSVPLGTLAWVLAAVASGGLILWLSLHEPTLASGNPPVVNPTPAQGTFSKLVDAGQTVDQIAALREQLKLARIERDEAMRQLAQARQAPSALRRMEFPAVIAKAGSGAEAAVPASKIPASPTPQPIEFPIPPPLPVVTRPLLAIPEPRFVGMWFWTKPKSGNQNKQLYPPEYIETSIVEKNGSIHGRYRAKYHITDRTISPDVSFEFDGKVSGGTAQLPWQGVGGSKGEVKIKLISDSSMELMWSATELGRSLGLSAGTAVLVRREN